MKLGSVQFFVLDEADRLLDTGNQEAIQKLHKKILVKSVRALPLLLPRLLPHSCDGVSVFVRARPGGSCRRYCSQRRCTIRSSKLSRSKFK